MWKKQLKSSGGEGIIAAMNKLVELANKAEIQEADRRVPVKGRAGKKARR